MACPWARDYQWFHNRRRVLSANAAPVRAVVAVRMRCVLFVTLFVVTATAATGCSMKRMGLDRMTDALSATAAAFARDDDPEFVRVGAPSTLKMVEMLLDDDPAHPGLLLTA